MQFTPTGHHWAYTQHIRSGLERLDHDLDRREKRAEQADGILEQRIERLELINMTLWSFLKEKLNLTEGDFVDRMAAIDLLDGDLDGKLSLNVKCKKCDRPQGTQRPNCVYCGEALAGSMDGTGFAAFDTSD